jgi:hypothetical protein
VAEKWVSALCSPLFSFSSLLAFFLVRPASIRDVCVNENRWGEKLGWIRWLVLRCILSFLIRSYRDVDRALVVNFQSYDMRLLRSPDQESLLEYERDVSEKT